VELTDYLIVKEGKDVTDPDVRFRIDYTLDEGSNAPARSVPDYPNPYPCHALSVNAKARSRGNTGAGV
jgi:hypothetical protein